MVEETETKKMNISVISQELFVEAVNTLPIECSSMEFRMFAIEPDFPKKDDSEEKLVSKCLENDIIPNSMVQLTYNQSVKGFVPDNFRIFYNNLSESIQKLMEGGRFNEINVKVTNTNSCDAFESFRKEYRYGGLLDLMLRTGYKLNNGDIEGHYGNSSLVFSSGYFGGKRFELTLGHKLAEEEGNKLTGWFNELKDKYQHKQSKLSFDTA